MAGVADIIAQAAGRYGVSPQALQRIAQIESSMNPQAQNPNSSAGGLFQFIDSTASQYGLQNRFDPAQASDAAARLARDNKQILESRLGRSITPGELYLAHQQGAGGALKLLSNPNARAVDVVGAEAVRLNGGTPDMTAGEFANKWINKAGGAAPLPTGGQQMAEQPQGLLGRARQPGGILSDTGFLNPDRRDRLILALEGMTLNPNQGLQQAALSGIQERSKARSTTQQRNATAEWLRGRGREDLAAGVESGAVPAQAAVEAAMTPTAPQKGVEIGGRLVNPVTGEVIADFSQGQGVTQITGAQLAERFGVDPESVDPNKLYNVDKDGKITQIGGGGVNIDLGERETAFQKEVGKTLATQATDIIAQGATAQRNAIELRSLEEALKSAPQGVKGQLVAIAGSLGLPVDGVDDVQAAESIINRLVPQQRPVGSGTMSDADLRLFQRSLPRIVNQPGGNERIISTLKDIAEYDLKRAEIAQSLVSGNITQDDANKKYMALTNPLGWLSERSAPSQPDNGGGFTVKRTF